MTPSKGRVRKGHNSLFLEHDVRVGVEVRHVYLLSVLEDFRVLAHAQPADVRKPEAAIGVVRVGVGVRVLVMLPVVTHPDPEAVLAGQRVHVQQNDL